MAALATYEDACVCVRDVDKTKDVVHAMVTAVEGCVCMYVYVWLYVCAHVYVCICAYVFLLCISLWADTQQAACQAPG